jgi:hypothetical protein
MIRNLTLIYIFKGGLNARVGKLNAIARAGSDVTVTWSGMIKMHHGPVMTVG